MNYSRLHQVGRGELPRESAKESPRQDTILEDTRQQHHHFGDSRNCIGKVSNYADFDYQYAMAMHISSRDKINLPPYESSKAAPYVPVVSSNVEDMLPCDNVVAPSTNVTSPVRDSITAGNYAIVPIFRGSTTTKPSDISNVNCNMAAGHIIATAAAATTMCTVPPLANVNSSNKQRTVTFCSKEQLTDPQMETCTANMARNCQLKSVDVEDLASYFDWSSTTESSKPSSSANRMIHTKRSRQGKRLDQTRQLRCERTIDVQSQCNVVNNDLTTCNLRSNDLISSTLQSGALEVNALPSYNLESVNVNYDNVVAFHDIQSCDLRTDDLGIDNLGSNDLRSIYKLSSNVSEFCDPGCFDSQSYDGAASCSSNGLRNCNVKPCEQVFDDGEKNYPRQCNTGQCNPGLNNGFCNNNCPELFNFCTEERWLQCPASARCPLYDLSYIDNTGPILPPCMYENLQPGCNVNENWNHDYTEDEQLLEYYVSNEKRKERSRDAARCRRSIETDIFAELAAVLPISPEQTAHLDKASVMRLAIAYLKMRAVVDSVPVSVMKSESSVDMDQLFSKALNGFMLVLSNDGNMVYLSENVSDYLGISQMDMMGQSVYEYSHPCDHEELRECLSSKSAENNENRSCNFLLRLKCTLTSKGRKVNLKSASYKVIHCTGRLINIRDSNSNSKSAQIDQEEQDRKDDSSQREIDASLVLVGCPIPHPSNIEIPLGRHTFLSKHNLSMKFTYVDEKLAEYLGWNSGDLMDRSVFEFHHALDNRTLDKSFKCLFNKGQCETVAYRFLSKKGGYAWVVTQATLIQCPKQQKPISVVCVNYIIRGISPVKRCIKAPANPPTIP